MQNKNLLEVVISRYSEDMSWVSNIPENCKFVIYNKGNDLHIPSVKLKNIGRESHTYIHHIVSNYNNLSDYTIFVQGNPFDHSPGLIGYIQNLLNLNEVNQDFFWLTSNMFRTDFEYKREPNMSVCPYIKFAYETIFGESPNFETFIFGGGAQFCVSKSRIQERSFDFYKNILDIFEKVPVGNSWEDYDEITQKLLANTGTTNMLYSEEQNRKLRNVYNPVCPELGSYMERLWGLIFKDSYTGTVYDHLHGGALQIENGVPI